MTTKAIGRSTYTQAKQTPTIYTLSIQRGGDKKEEKKCENGGIKQTKCVKERKRYEESGRNVRRLEEM